jgi:TonB family protein
MCDLKFLLTSALIIVNSIVYGQTINRDTTFFFLTKTNKEIKVERKSKCQFYRVCNRNNEEETFNIRYFTRDDSLIKDDTYKFTFPKFNGDIEKYISENIIYPPKSVKWGKEGKVIVNFKVTESGEITNVEVIRSAHRLLDKEAVRIVKNMPKWIPGTFENKPSANYFQLPINFKIED